MGYKQTLPIGAWPLLPSQRNCRRFGASTKSATPTSPTAGVKLPRVKDETSNDILSLAEVEKLFAQVDTSTVLGLRDRAILALMLVNGLREVEIVRANYGDLKEMDDIKVLVVHGKGGREDETVLRDDVHQALTAYLETRGNLKLSSPLFIGANHRAGKRMSTRTIRHRIDHYLEKAGLKRKGISGHSDWTLSIFPKPLHVV